VKREKREGGEKEEESQGARERVVIKQKE